MKRQKKYMDSLYERQGVPEAWDATSGVSLGPAKVKEARAEEMRFFKNLTFITGFLDQG